MSVANVEPMKLVKTIHQEQALKNGATEDCVRDSGVMKKVVKKLYCS